MSKVQYKTLTLYMEFLYFIGYKGALNVPDNIKLAYLLPYCPELNPSENMWDEMRERFFTNLVFDSLDAVMDKLEETMIFYQQSLQIVKSITSFNWIKPYI